MAFDLPNGDPTRDPNEYARAELDRGRDLSDIVRELGLDGGSRDAPPPGNEGSMHPTETPALPNGDPAGPSAFDKQHMLDAAQGITQGSIDLKAGNPGNGRALAPDEQAFDAAHPQGGNFHLIDPQGSLTAGNAHGPTLGNGNNGGLPNGAPTTDHFNTRLGDQTTASGPASGKDYHSFDKGTYEFRQGEYVPGKGVADKDGYFDPNYMSEANIVNNARNGDDSAHAKLEVMAKAGNEQARAMLADLGNQSQFEGSKLHADWQGGHNSSVNTALENGAYKGNVEARLNLADQRQDFVAHLETTRQSNPTAADMMEKVASIGGRQVSFDNQGVTWVDTKGDEHRVAIGQIERMLPELDKIIAANSKTAADDEAAYEATKKKK